MSEPEMIVRTAGEMREVLLQKNLPPSFPVYYVLRAQNPVFGREPNITIIPAARLGKEFPKTFGHFHQHGESEQYRVLYGEALVLLQKIEKEKAVEVRLARGGAGERLIVPEGFGHCLINATDNLLITADWESDEAGHSYNLIREKHGMAYYVVEEGGKAVFQPNPRYGKVPPLREI